MSGTRNKAQIIGYLGADPEIRRTDSGSSIANFSVATTETWKDKQTGEPREATEWHRVVVFGPYGGGTKGDSEGLVGVVRQFLKKGSKVFIEGPLRTRKWKNQAGEDRWTTEIHIQGYGADLILLDRSDRAPPPADEPGRDRASGGGMVSSYHQRQQSSRDDAGPLNDMRQDMDDEIPF